MSEKEKPKPPSGRLVKGGETKKEPTPPSGRTIKFGENRNTKK